MILQTASVYSHFITSGVFLLNHQTMAVNSFRTFCSHPMSFNYEFNENNSSNGVTSNILLYCTTDLIIYICIQKK